LKGLVDSSYPSVGFRSNSDLRNINFKEQLRMVKEEIY
jgi:hypothetical protein